MIAGIGDVLSAAGWLFVISAIFAWYTATAMMLKGVMGRELLPVGKPRRTERTVAPSPGIGEPGVIHGQ